jgi:hypothetical protein
MSGVDDVSLLGDERAYGVKVKIDIYTIRNGLLVRVPKHPSNTPIDTTVLPFGSILISRTVFLSSHSVNCFLPNPN